MRLRTLQVFILLDICLNLKNVICLSFIIKFKECDLILLYLKFIDRTMSVMYPELFEHFENCAQGNLVLSQRMKKVVCFKMFAVKNTHVAFSDQGNDEIRVKQMRKHFMRIEKSSSSGTKLNWPSKLAFSSEKDVYVET